MGITTTTDNKPIEINGGTETDNINIDITPLDNINFSTAALKVKVFLWDSCDDMNAYGPADVVWQKN